MKFESFYIECKNKDQRNELSKHLEDVGFKYVESEDFDLTIGCYRNGFYQYLDHRMVYGSPTYDFEYFMKNHMNEMIKKIHQAKKELGLNNSELSLRMGKSRPYIAKMFNQKQSEKVQNKVIKEIDELLEFDLRCKQKAYAEAASELNKGIEVNVSKFEVDQSQLPASIDSAGLLDELSVLRHQNGLKDKEIAELKRTIESKDLAISGLIKQNDEAKKIHDKDLIAIKTKDDIITTQSANLELIITDKESLELEVQMLKAQLNGSRKTVDSLKSKIIRERWIIMIVIAILTGLFFLKGAIGG